MKKITVFLIALVFLTACSSKPKNTLQQFSKSTITAGFDTTITIIGFAKSEDKFDELFEKGRQKFWHYHELFDIYNNYDGINNMKTINDNAGKEAVKVDEEIIDMLITAKKYSDISEYFNVTYGSVFKVWHEYREEGIDLNVKGEPGRIPTEEELLEAAEHVGWDLIEIDEQAQTVYIKDEKASLDVGAIAKGLATEKVALYLEEEGLEHGIISGGGNIRTINQKPDGPWKIGIQEPSPAKDAPSLDILSIDKSYSVVTSGDYQRTYYGPDEVPYSHLINPKTLWPQTSFRSVSIVMESSTLADIFSTSMFMMEYDDGVAFIDEYNKKYPEDRLDVFWIVDENEDWYQGDGFDYMMTSGLEPLSRNLNE